MARPELQAHRGVESEYPGNTMVSFRAAVKQGYERIELDLRMTKDGQVAVLHDRKINSTARLPDGSRLTEDVFLSDLTYDEALGYDFGIAFSERFRGEKIPLFRDVLSLAAESGVSLKIDNKLFEMTEEDRGTVYALIRESGAHVCVSCFSLADAKEVLAALPDAEVSYDGLTDPERLKELNGIVGRDKLTVWIPIDRQMARWAPEKWFASPGEAALIRPYARLGIWAIADRDSFHRACRLYDPDAAETSGVIKPSDRTADEAKETR